MLSKHIIYNLNKKNNNFLQKGVKKDHLVDFSHEFSCNSAKDQLQDKKERLSYNVKTQTKQVMFFVLWDLVNDVCAKKHEGVTLTSVKILCDRYGLDERQCRRYIAQFKKDNILFFTKITQQNYKDIKNKYPKQAELYKKNLGYVCNGKKKRKTEMFIVEMGSPQKLLFLKICKATDQEDTTHMEYLSRLLFNCSYTDLKLFHKFEGGRELRSNERYNIMKEYKHYFGKRAKNLILGNKAGFRELHNITLTATVLYVDRCERTQQKTKHKIQTIRAYDAAKRRVEVSKSYDVVDPYTEIISDSIKQNNEVSRMSVFPYIYKEKLNLGLNPCGKTLKNERGIKKRGLIRRCFVPLWHHDKEITSKKLPPKWVFEIIKQGGSIKKPVKGKIFKEEGQYLSYKDKQRSNIELPTYTYIENYTTIDKVKSKIRSTILRGGYVDKEEISMEYKISTEEIQAITDEINDRLNNNRYVDNKENRVSENQENHASCEKYTSCKGEPGSFSENPDMGVPPPLPRRGTPFLGGENEIEDHLENIDDVRLRTSQIIRDPSSLDRGELRSQPNSEKTCCKGKSFSDKIYAILNS